MRSMRSLRASGHAAPRVPSKTTREEEAEKTMARRKLSLDEQLSGVRAAIRSKRTPPQLREGLKQRAEWLKKQIGKTSPPKKKNKGAFLFF